VTGSEGACQIRVQICRGLAVAHERDIVHRDLKPEKVFLTFRSAFLNAGATRVSRGS